VQIKINTNAATRSRIKPRESVIKASFFLCFPVYCQKCHRLLWKGNLCKNFLFNSIALTENRFCVHFHDTKLLVTDSNENVLNRNKKVL